MSTRTTRDKSDRGKGSAWTKRAMAYMASNDPDMVRSSRLYEMLEDLFIMVNCNFH